MKLPNLKSESYELDKIYILNIRIKLEYSPYIEPDKFKKLTEELHTFTMNIFENHKRIGINFYKEGYPTLFKIIIKTVQVDMTMRTSIKENVHNLIDWADKLPKEMSCEIDMEMQRLR